MALMPAGGHNKVQQQGGGHERRMYANTYEAAVSIPTPA